MTLQFEGVGFGAGPGSGGKIGTVALVAMGSQPSTPYTVGSKWFYNGKIYTATSTTTTDGGVTPSYDTAYLFNGTYYYWDGSTLQGADESNLVHISGTETITGNKTFSGSVALGDNASAQTKPTSDTSDAPATTKFVKDYVQDGEWQKPADWIDIRSGALDNSVYFLVAHSKPTGTPGSYVIAEYKNWNFFIDVSTNTNTYDVFVDGIKVATTASGTETTINWATLYNNNTIKSGYDIASPGSGNYTTHIIRVAPTVATDTIVGVRCFAVTGETEGQGVLWVHFELSNATKINRLLGSTATTTRNQLCQAITAKNDKIKYVLTPGSQVTGLYSMAAYASALVKIPVLEAETNERVGDVSLAFNSVKTKKIIVKNNSEKMTISHIHNFKGEYFETENPVKFQSGISGTMNASGANNLKKLPAISTKEKGTTLIMGRLDSIEETFIDESFNDERTLLQIFGESGYQTNLVGLVVSPNAPFDYATAPQLSVDYTAMDRAALVRLFKSLPYNVGYTVVGSPTIVDGVASGFSASDYLTFPNITSFVRQYYKTDFEFQVKITAPSTINANEQMLHTPLTGTSCGLRISSNDGKIKWYIYGGTYTIESASGTISANETAYFKGVIKNATAELFKSSDGTTWTSLGTLDISEMTEEYSGTYGFRIGVSGSDSSLAPFQGSFSLPDTYVKIKGLPYFRGTAAMTKTISVIGCIGTPDLTAEDKAIAEDKGWSIVLS